MTNEQTHSKQARWRPSVGGLAAGLLVLAVFAVAGYGSQAQESCLLSLGQEGAQTYVDQCLEVTSATHPPCNVENSCEIMARHITESCETWAADISEDAAEMPDFCMAYLAETK